VDINKAWESIRENIKALATEILGYYELKQHKPWFDNKCPKLLDQREQTELQLLENPSQTNGDNMDNVQYETSRTL